MFHGSLQGIWAASHWNLIASGLGFYPSFLWSCSVQTPLPSRNIDHHPQGAGHIWLQLKSGEVTIRRPESVCSSNKFMRNPNRVQNPKSKQPWLGLPQEERIVQQSKIQNPRSRNPKSQIQNPNSKSKTQNPNSPLWFRILDDAGGGHGAIPATRIWPRRWAPETSRIPNWAPASRGGFWQPRVMEIGARFPENGGQVRCGKMAALGV